MMIANAPETGKTGVAHFVVALKLHLYAPDEAPQLLNWTGNKHPHCIDPVNWDVDRSIMTMARYCRWNSRATWIVEVSGTDTYTVSHWP
ncbi:MAG: hypothetical protein LBK00_08835 [Treponema sp.]|nr:hypothetical protein [Treponema sp.]